MGSVLENPASPGWDGFATAVGIPCVSLHLDRHLPPHPSLLTQTVL